MVTGFQRVGQKQNKIHKLFNAAVSETQIPRAKAGIHTTPSFSFELPFFLRTNVTTTTTTTTTAPTLVARPSIPKALRPASGEAQRVVGWLVGWFIGGVGWDVQRVYLVSGVRE